MAYVQVRQRGKLLFMYDPAGHTVMLMRNGKAYFVNLDEVEARHDPADSMVEAPPADSGQDPAPENVVIDTEKDSE